VTGDLTLGRRTGLPDALRVLVEQYSREAWEAHPNFTALTRFWLDRHLGFRRMQGVLTVETRGFLDRDRDPQAYAGGLARLAGMLLNELHGHHAIEDHHYFPLLRDLDPRLTAGFDLLDADHQVLDGAIHALATSTNRVLGALFDGQPGDLAAAGLDTELAAFARLLDRHLLDEEELVVPVILDHPGARLG
jgi:iron-sulfur cluster repair protein YtfE (RIC family)